MTRPIAPVEPRRLVALGLDPHIIEEVQQIVTGLEPDVSCLVTGSIVEGFGNANSDIDLYLIYPGSPSAVVSIGLRQSRYVDCEHLPVASLPRLAAQIREQTWDSLLELRRQDLDRCYRIAIGIPVALTDRTAVVLRAFSKSDATVTFGRLSVLRAYEYLSEASCHLAFDRQREADLLLRECVWWHSSSMLAADGEGYPSVKWMTEKAARRHGRGSLRFHELVDEALSPSGDLATRIERLRSRVRIPDELSYVLHRRACRLHDGVRLVTRGDDHLLVRAARAVAAVRGVVAHVCRHLIDGLSWLEATELTAVEVGIPVLEARVAAWSFMAPLRRKGFVEMIED